MGAPRYHGCKESLVKDRWGGVSPVNTMVNAYLRVGGHWKAVGEICTACEQFRPDKAALAPLWADQRSRSGVL